MRCLLLLAVGCLSVLSFGQGTRTLQFADSADRVVWSSPAATDPPNAGNSLKTKDPSAVWSPAPKDEVLCVLDVKSGNLASRTALPTDAWKVAPEEFNLIVERKVRVQQGGKPIDAASVTLNKTVTKLIDPSSKGEVSFYAVTPGHIRIDVAYKVDGKDRTLNQQTEIALKRSDPIPTIICDIGGSSSSSVPPPTAAPTGSKMPPPIVTPKPSGMGVIGGLILVMVAAAIALGVLYFGLKWIYANQEKTKDALAKVGVTVPDPIAADPDPDPVSTPVSMAAAVQTPIVLPGADLSAVPPPLVTGGFRLVGSLGSFDLGEGVHVVGREPGLAISVVGESTVSRRHAELIRQGTQLMVRDCGSTNGTFVNGQRVSGELPLHMGDSVQFGAISFRVEG